MYKGITGFIDRRVEQARLLLEVAHPRPVQAPASSQCQPPPEVPAHCSPANADDTSQSAQGSLKHASKPEGKDRSSRRPWSFKSKIPPELELKPEVSSTKASIEDQRANQSPKCMLKTEAHVKIGILDFCAAVNCKCQGKTQFRKKTVIMSKLYMVITCYYLS